MLVLQDYDKAVQKLNDYREADFLPCKILKQDLARIDAPFVVAWGPSYRFETTLNYFDPM